MTQTDAFPQPRHEYRILALMLTVVHLAIWWDFGGPISRSLMLTHLGLFLLWQPLWSRDRHLELPAAALFITVSAVFVAFLSWGLMTFWMLLLTGFIGGRVTVGTRERSAYLIGLVFVVSEILVGCIPPMFHVQSLSDEFRQLFRFGLLAVPAVLFFVPPQLKASTSAQSVRSVDFLYGLTASLLTVVLAMGSLLIMYSAGTDYPVALMQSVLVIAFFLLAISWLWAPLAGFAGLGQLWERYILNIGTPFEQWLRTLTRLARQEEVPAAFMDGAMGLLTELPWVAGAAWRTDDGSGRAGAETPHEFHHAGSGTEFIVYTHRSTSVLLRIHCTLLLRLVTHFRLAKVHERELAQRAHLQAVYETGARVTHDIKNLLQSMHGMTAIVENRDTSRHDEAQKMLRRQLPHLTSRLQLALDKLQIPDDATVTEKSLEAWWEDLKARNSVDDVRFEAEISTNRKIPVDLFDSVVENLLENARSKRQTEPGIEIAVKLQADAGHTSLSVSDTGSDVDPEIVPALFKAPVKSTNGLGIGLYQAAVYAEQLGYRLRLEDKQGSGVRFELSGAYESPVRSPG
jgi:signal transduction histidine kinase